MCCLFLCLPLYDTASEGESGEMEEVFNRKIGGKQLNKIRSQDSLAPIKTVSAFIAVQCQVLKNEY